MVMLMVVNLIVLAHTFADLGVRARHMLRRAVGSHLIIIIILLLLICGVFAALWR